jgi:hypothetical protein
MDKPFEHEQLLKDLVATRAGLNRALDLDKHDSQVAPDEPEGEKQAAPATFMERIRRERTAEIAL